jgi:hypothetical protein
MMRLKKECGFKPVGLHERTHFGNGGGGAERREGKGREEKGIIKDFDKTFWGVWS